MNRENVGEIFAAKDYIGDYFTGNLKDGDIFYYKTTDVNYKHEYLFKMMKTNVRHKSCNMCPLMSYICNGIECYCVIKKILKYG